MSGEPKTRPTSASVPDFLARQPGARRADCEAVCAMMPSLSSRRLLAAKVMGTLPVLVMT